ncbi:hypothetical protein [Microbacterium sp. P04]|uniref:hypothetical protein n=1 Tax=Microbacterium sp. P04 TaxID=3366947 RepID=UPI00374576CC
MDATFEIDTIPTPAYVYDAEKVRRQVDGLRRALPDGARLYYSAKANSHPGILAEVSRLGCSVEVCSSGELGDAFVAGVPRDRIMYTGPVPEDAELESALQAGVRRFAVESRASRDRLDALCARLHLECTVLVRVNPATTARGRINMAGSSQFGVDFEELLADPSLLAEGRPTRVGGLQFYAFSNAESEDDLLTAFFGNIDAARILRERHGTRLREIDLGGGFAAPFGTPGDSPDYRSIKERLTTRIRRHLGTEVVVAFESGRHLVAGAGRFVTTVREIKRSRGVRYAICDAGVNHLGGVATTRRLTPPRMVPTWDPLVERTDASVATPPPDPGSVTVVGPLCTPADRLCVVSDEAGTVRAGTRLIFDNVGAYGLTASPLAFLRRETPVEILHGSGRVVDVSRLVVGREKVEL